ncbi:MAG: beta-lactamase-like protein [Caulobacter sp.]|nr:beta-lactamase-like protein [Caulobacter sp.]
MIRTPSIRAAKTACLALILAGAGFALNLAPPTAPTASAAASFDATWGIPQEPFRIADNLYYVGDQDLAVYLIVTPQGLIVLDGGYGKTGPQVLANIRKLGFNPARIKILLNSHAHADHAGGLAAIKAASGAALFASARDKPYLENGGHDDPVLGNALLFAPVKVDHVLRDGEQVSLGGVSLTAHLTPGHTPGCTSWSMAVKVDGKTRQALFICSLTVLPMAHLSGPKASWPGVAGDFEQTYKVLHALPCELFFGSHGGFYGMQGKRAALAANPKAANPFIDPAGCKAYIDRGEASFRARLAAEK